MRWLEGNTWPSQQEAVFLRFRCLIEESSEQDLFRRRNEMVSSLRTRRRFATRKKIASCCDGHVLPSSHRIAHGRGMDLLPGIEVPQRRAVSSNHRLK